MNNEKEITEEILAKSKWAAVLARKVHEHCLLMNDAQRELDKVQAEILKLAESLE